jgi:GrpB-like predicted nucleotidyltransferase (UPF0157 family)
MLKIVPYQETWPQEFRQIAGRMRLVLGDLALRIDHIGSTAVPALEAKDVIDLQVSVAELSEEIASRLKSAGFVQPAGIWKDHQPPNGPEGEDEWSKFLFVQPDGERRMNIHVRGLGRANQRYALLFRDYLRAHPAMAAAYGQLKQRLAENLADTQAYPDVKDPAVDLIYLAAEDWAAATGWQPGPSDA